MANDIGMAAKIMPKEFYDGQEKKLAAFEEADKTGQRYYVDGSSIAANFLSSRTFSDKDITAMNTMAGIQQEAQMQVQQINNEFNPMQADRTATEYSGEANVRDLMSQLYYQRQSLYILQPLIKKILKDLKDKKKFNTVERIKLKFEEKDIDRLYMNNKNRMEEDARNMASTGQAPVLGIPILNPGGQAIHTQNMTIDPIKMMGYMEIHNDLMNILECDVEIQIDGQDYSKPYLRKELLEAAGQFVPAMPEELRPKAMNEFLMQYARYMDNMPIGREIEKMLVDYEKKSAEREAMEQQAQQAQQQQAQQQLDIQSREVESKTQERTARAEHLTSDAALKQAQIVEPEIYLNNSGDKQEDTRVARQRTDG